MSSEIFCFELRGEHDLEAIALLVERANAQRDGMVVPCQLEDKNSVQNIQGTLSKPGAWTYVAKSEQRIAGVAIGYPRQEPGEDGVDYLSLLMVDPDYWGKRVASKLLDIATAISRGNGMGVLALWTRKDDNEHARGVYKHKGFTLSGKLRMSRHGDGEQVEYILNL